VISVYSKILAVEEMSIFKLYFVATNSRPTVNYDILYSMGMLATMLPVPGPVFLNTMVQRLPAAW